MLSKLRRRYFDRLDVKLTVYFTLIVFFCCSTLCVFLHYRLQRNLVKQVDRLLRDEMHEFIQVLEAADGRTHEACIRFEAQVSNRHYYPIYFKLYNDRGAEICSSANTLNYALPPPSVSHSRSYTHTLPSSSSLFRVYEQQTLLVSRERVIVQITTELKEVDELLEQFDSSIALSLSVVIIFSILFGMLIMRKPHRIIRKIATVTERVSGSNLGERLSVPDTADEMKDLSMNINFMLDRLERAFAETRQFTADVSHELRTPLFAMKGTMEVALSKTRAAQEYRDVIIECHERIQMLIKMTNDLFLVSRFDSNLITLTLSYLNLKDVVQDMYELYLPMAQEKKVRLSIGASDDDVVVKVDKTKIPQLLSNLLDNAIKFTPPGGDITITLAKRDHAVEISLRDTGVGVSHDELSSIFDRFYQSNKSRSGSERGAGLGLQICKKIAEAHGGSIRSTLNEPAPGMTFIFSMPADG